MLPRHFRLGWARKGWVMLEEAPLGPGGGGTHVAFCGYMISLIEFLLGLLQFSHTASRMMM